MLANREQTAKDLALVRPFLAPVNTRLLADQEFRWFHVVEDEVSLCGQDHLQRKQLPVSGP